MKITTFKVPAKVKRANGTIELILDESKKERVDEEKVNLNPTDIPSKAKEISDANDINRALAKNVLMARENEADTFVELKYLTD